MGEVLKKSRATVQSIIKKYQTTKKIDNILKNNLEESAHKLGLLGSFFFF